MHSEPVRPLPGNIRRCSRLGRMSAFQSGQNFTNVNRNVVLVRSKERTGPTPVAWEATCLAFGDALKLEESQ